MKCHFVLMLLLIWTAECSVDNSFLISAPAVFHLDVNEKVFVQMGRHHLNNVVTLYLERELHGTVVSEKKTVVCTDESETKTVELMITRETWSQYSQTRPYLMLVAESPTLGKRRMTRVLVTKHRGYIFIQTDQPIYKPTDKVNYRLFTLDHTLRPHMETVVISVFNAAGNRILKTYRTADGGIFRDTFPIPDVSEPGTWNITAHYQGDEANAASREFKVQKFVLPSFDVNIQMEAPYVLVNAEQLDFTILAKYTHGEKVKGSYHCRFGVLKKPETRAQKMKPQFIKGLELAGSVEDGSASVSLLLETINLKLQKQLNQSLSDLQKSGAQFYLGVFVTNIQSGEIQEAEVYLPVVSHKYTIDLSRTRSYFIPGFPLDVTIIMHFPNGSPAAGVPLNITVQSSSLESWEGTTDQEGAVFHSFNIQEANEITVEVSAGGLRQRKILTRASSPSSSYLYMTFTNKMYSVKDLLRITYNTINAPVVGRIYYMVLSRGIIVNNGSLQMGTSVKHNLQITPDMVPAFRLIGYYHNDRGDIIADSLWVDVRDECEIKVEVKGNGPFTPGKFAPLEVDLHGAEAKVALLAVDKAFYALNTDNKLTAKQVFSSMNSYDLGCSYGGGSDSASVLLDAGLSFVSDSKGEYRKDFGCNSPSARPKRSVDLQQEMMTLKSTFSDPNLEACCVQGFSLIPMVRTCQERMERVLLVKKNQTCADTFLECCRKAEKLRQQKMLEDAQRGLGRTSFTDEIEQLLLDPASQYIRRHFPPSFEFREYDVNNKRRFLLNLPDTITTWEIQVVTLSAATGFCVVKPTEVRAFKETFVSLKLPYSVKKYEQLSISPVIYNYDDKKREVGVHMEQTEGLCSPGSATTTSFVNFTLEPHSSQLVSFSAVPMVTGSIPIKIRLFDMEWASGIDAVIKMLNVQTEGFEHRVEETHVFKLDGRSAQIITIDGTLPGNTVPESRSNIFISIEGDGFSNSHAKNLLSPEKVANLIVLPQGCIEQTMTGLVPTALALRYLDLSDQWFDLPAGKRDDTLDKLEKGVARILHLQDKSKGYYRSWRTVPYSNWVTALVVKVLSLVAERQTVAVGQQGRTAEVITGEDIRLPVSHLLSAQRADGSFGDADPVLHRGMLTGKDKEASMSAFITIALYRSLQFLQIEQRSAAEESLSRSATYLVSHLEELQHPFAVAITAYCLSVCLPPGENRTRAWTKLQAMVVQGENDCYLWTTNPSPENKKKADAITIQTTAYALLAAVELEQTTWADRIACWLTTQENYNGGFLSTQDTMMSLEALSEYELKRSAIPEVNMIAEFRNPDKKGGVVTLQLENKKQKVETDLKRLAGHNIQVRLTGKGDAKFKVLKAFHLLDPSDECDRLSIRVTVEGKVKYTAKIMENYDYYDYDTDEGKLERVQRSATEWLDARSRSRRDVDNDSKSDEVVTYDVCVSLNSNLTGMAIADITLLSGFEAKIEDLERLKLLPEQYITHYELSYGRVVIYFNELFQREECIRFDAVQRVPIGLLQPAPAVFYDYYEPNRRCTVFYSAPKRSKMISRLCSEDVCQCAERPCHKVQETFKVERNRRLTKNDREKHACFFPRADYAYMVEVLSVSLKSNFELYKTNVTEVLRLNGDLHVNVNSVRVFAKRLQCKGELDLGKQYLIMGKDGSTTDSNGAMQYLLESDTWVERKPSREDCKKSAHRMACAGFNAFISEYKTDGCRQ